MTAEGLLQSAIDYTADADKSPLHKMERREVFRSYASLCKDWERREADAIKFGKEAAELDASLPEA